MRDHQAMAAFARGIHQDVFVGLKDERDLAELLVSNMIPAERAAFRAWLEKALQTLTQAEMRNLLNRANSSLGFSSGAAYALLRAAADRVGTG